MATAWYRDGSIMLMEEYDNDRLVKGQYLSAVNAIRSPTSKMAVG